MNFFKNIAATALTGLSLFASLSAPVHASMGVQENHQRHVVLATAIQEAGIDVYVNPSACDNKPVFGWYSGAQRVLVICQENRDFYPAGKAPWTAEDYDTLRHEAQHLIQDCMDNRIDHNLSPVYRNPIALAQRVLGTEAMSGIHNSYTSIGANLSTVILEYEAFAVAALNDPLEQVQDIRNYCGVN